MALQLVTSPVGLPVSVDQAKAQSRIVYTDAAQDDLIGLYIQTATNYIERLLSRKLITQTWKYLCDDFPCNREPLWLPTAPVQSVSSVKYYAEDGTQTIWNANSYVVDVAGEPSRIEPVWGGSWPVYQTRINAVEVQFVCGYGTASSVPAELKQAILMMAAHLYETRETTTDVQLLEAPYAVRQMTDIYRWHPNAIATLL